MATRPTTTTPLANLKGGEHMSDKLVYSVSEAADLLSIGRTTAFQLIASGELRSLKIGNRRLVSRVDLDDFVAELRRSAA